MGAATATDRLVAGTGREVVWPGAGVRHGVSAPGESPHQHHAGPADAGDAPLLRGRAAPAWQPAGVRAALSWVGAVAQFPAVAPRNDAGQRRLAQPGRTAESTSLPRRLAPKPVGVRFAGWIPPPKSLAPQSVTVSFFPKWGNAAALPHLLDSAAR